MFQTKAAEKITTHIVCPIILFTNRSLYEIMWKNTVQPDRPQMTYNMAHALCVAVDDDGRTG
jgi:hypothetical protein